MKDPTTTTMKQFATSFLASIEAQHAKPKPPITTAFVREAINRFNSRGGNEKLRQALLFVVETYTKQGGDISELPLLSHDQIRIFEIIGMTNEVKAAERFNKLVENACKV